MRVPSQSTKAHQIKSLPKLWRLAILVVLLLGVYLLGRALGLTSYLTTWKIRSIMRSAGFWGLAFYFAAYVTGNLLHVPGLVFISTGILAYGSLAGGGVALLGSILAVSFSFAIVRLVGGQALGELEKPWVKKMLSQLNSHPILTIALLRIVLISSPPLNYALALSEVRYRDYLIGSTLGLILPVLSVSIFFQLVVL